ncbi:MAG: transposase, partial [Candidatus Zixiibacteriota bacterium]
MVLKSALSGSRFSSLRFCRRCYDDNYGKYLGEVIRDLAQQKESKVWEGHLMPDHAHILVSIPPKYAVAQ